MKTVSFYLLDNQQQEEFFSWLKSQKNNDSAYENMWDDAWQTKPECLPYILSFTNKFKDSKGDFHIIYDGNNIVGCGGVCLSSFNRYIALGGVRTWVSEKYRNKSILKEHLFPYHKAWAIDNSCRQIALSFNNYNKNIITVFKRARLGEDPSRSQRTEKHLFYTGIHEVSHAVLIQYTPQWVIYEKLDQTWNFNWATLKETKS
jgi:hypothetical protein